MPAEQLTRGTRTRTATFKPAPRALLRHLLVSQLPKPKIRVALGLELASSGHCGKQTRDFGKACDLCRADVERLGASADCLAPTLFTPQPQVTVLTVFIPGPQK